MQNKIRVTGLTGSIGTGKSTAASLFKEKGIPVIDADELSREAVSGGSAALHEIAEEFGRKYVTEDGQLDRKRLAGLVFTDESARRRLDGGNQENIQKAIEGEEIGTLFPGK